MENKSKTWLASVFTTQREIIEAAETPFAKLAVFVLPIIAPLVPASVTGLHLYSLFISIFGEELKWLAVAISGISSLVLELLGYVGAIAFIKSVFNWVRVRAREYMVPMVLNGVAYFFYLLLMFLVNVMLGAYLGEKSIVTGILGLLSFITLPTGLLAANHLNETAQEEQEQDKRLREDKLRKEQEEREDRIRLEQYEREAALQAKRDALSLEKYRIKHGTILESSGKFQEKMESSKKVPEKAPDWRKFRPTLSMDDLRDLASLTPQKMETYSSETGFTYKTISNWRMRARLELGMEEGQNEENQV